MKSLAIALFAVAGAGLLTGCSSVVTPSAAESWVCKWDPTINDNWHDDYLCTNGTSSERPTLLPEDSFVDGAEIDDAAAAYEAQLNS